MTVHMTPHDPLCMTQRALTKRINRALAKDDLVLRPTAWSGNQWGHARDAYWYIWFIPDPNCIPLGPYLPSQLVTIGLACGALRPFERNRVVLDARGEPVPTLAAWDGTDAFPEPITVAVFAPRSEHISSGLVPPGSDTGLTGPTGASKTESP